MHLVDGGWSNFTNIGNCSNPCGEGNQTQQRTCTNPSPKYEGKLCNDSSGNPALNETRIVTCHLKNCPGMEWTDL